MDSSGLRDAKRAAVPLPVGFACGYHGAAAEEQIHEGFCSELGAGVG